MYIQFASDFFITGLSVYVCYNHNQNLMAVVTLFGLSILLIILANQSLWNNKLKVFLIYLSFCCKYLGLWFLGDSDAINFLLQGIICQTFNYKCIFDHIYIYELIGMFGLTLNIFNKDRIVNDNSVILSLELLIVIIFIIQIFRIMNQNFHENPKHNLIQNQVIIDLIANPKLKQDYEATPSQSPRLTLQKLFESNNFIIIKENLEILESNFDLKIHCINESIPQNSILIEQFMDLQVISSNFGENQEVYSFKEFIIKFKENLKSQFASIIISKSQIFDLENTTLNLMPFYQNENQYLIVQFSYLSQLLFKRINYDDSRNNVLMDISRSLSHELGTNLNSIMIFSSLALKDDDVPNHIKQKYISPLKINSEQLSLIVSNIRDYNLISLQQFSLKLEEFNINDEIRYIESLMIDIIKNKQINLVYDYQLINPIIINDRQRFRQVYFQFLSNAVKYTFNGTIYIKIEMNRWQCQISIQDSGPGLSEEEMARMKNILIGKNQFVKISNHSVGCGLGIGISNSIIKRLNGLNIPITCENEEKGTIFSFQIKNHLHEVSNYDNRKSVELKSSRSIIRLISGNSYIESPFSNSVKFIIPSINQSSDSVNQKNSIVEDDNLLRQPKLILVQDQVSLPISDDEFVIIQEPRIMSPKFQYQIIECSIQSNCCSRVLIVDDEYFNILSLQLLMQKHKAKCDYAYNGKEALDKIMQKLEKGCHICQNKYYSLIFIDINMPILNGYQTVKEIKNLIKNQTIRKVWCVANTGFTDLDTKLQSFNSGMDYFLTKPLDAKNLHDLIVQMFPLQK